MTTPAPTPDTPPERILPTEPGWWWTKLAADTELAAAAATEVWYDTRYGLVWDPDPCDRNQSVLPVASASITWLARIPTPEQLSAMSAQLVAGQALADHLRLRMAAAVSHGVEALAVEFGDPLVTGLLAAFPEGGAR